MLKQFSIHPQKIFRFEKTVQVAAVQTMPITMLQEVHCPFERTDTLYKQSSHISFAIQLNSTSYNK